MGENTTSGIGKVFLFILIIAIIIFSFNNPFSTPSTIENDGILQTTIAREKLKTDSKLLIGYDNYTNDVETNKDKRYINEGLKIFYEETGVPPYLILVDQAEIIKTLKSQDGGYSGICTTDTGEITDKTLGDYTEFKYNRLFNKSKVHFLVVGCITNTNDYKYDYIVGKDAEKLIDIDAWNIFNSCLSAFDKEDYTEAEWIYNVYVNAAHNIMNPAFTVEGAVSRGLKTIKKVVTTAGIFILILVLIIIAICATAMIRSVQRSKKAELEKRLNEVTNTTEPEYIDERLKELEEKYRDVER